MRPRPVIRAARVDASLQTWFACATNSLRDSTGRDPPDAVCPQPATISAARATATDRVPIALTERSAGYDRPR